MSQRRRLKPTSPQPVPAVDPRKGITALRDATTAVRCAMNADEEGLRVVVNHTDEPRIALAALAALTAGMLLQSAGDPAGIEASLAGAERFAFDTMLDLRPRPAAPAAAPGR